MQISVFPRIAFRPTVEWLHALANISDQDLKRDGEKKQLIFLFIYKTRDLIVKWLKVR